MASYTQSRANFIFVDVAQLRPHDDAIRLHTAMVGTGTNVRTIMSILSNRTNQQRQLIADAYFNQYHKNLMEDLKKELSGPFEELVLAMMMPSADYDAALIRKAVKGLGTDEDMLMEIFCTRTYSEMQNIKAAYNRLYKKDLVKDVEGDTSGDFKKLCQKLMERGGDHQLAGHMTIDRAAAQRDAQMLYAAGEGKMGTDEVKFYDLLTGHYYTYLRVVFDEYHKLNKRRTIEEAIKSEFSGDVKKGLLTLVQVIRNTPEFFAQKLNKALTHKKEKTVIRLTVTRSEIDLHDIKADYARLYGKTLAEHIHQYVNGPARDMLIEMAN